MNFMNNWYIIDPVLLQIGPLAIHWYGIMYILAFSLGYLWIQKSKLGKSLHINADQKEFLLFCIVMGIMIGGRLGYILFYNLSFYVKNPLEIFAIWHGGMSFHGGLIGATLMILYFSRKHRINFLKITDLVTSVAPLGLFFGRIGNFINGELYGKIASKFCINFPTDLANCRYPTQLLEALLEGLILFIILTIIRKFYKSTGIISASFLLFYGIFRSFIEFFREPDSQIGYIFNVLTEGQILSFFMIIGSVILILFINKKRI